MEPSQDQLSADGRQAVGGRGHDLHIGNGAVDSLHLVTRKLPGSAIGVETSADDDFVLSGEGAVEETPAVPPSGISEPPEADPEDPHEVLALSAAARADEEPETGTGEDAAGEEEHGRAPEVVASEAASSKAFPQV